MANFRALGVEEATKVMCAAIYGKEGGRYHENMEEVIRTLASHDILLIHVTKLPPVTPNNGVEK